MIDRVIITIVLIIGLYGCDVFPTRQPEEPVNPGQSYLPATTQNLLLENFIKSINSADYNNYIKCFACKSSGQIKEFNFIPSGDVFNIYASLFQNWNYNEEIRNFKSVVSNINAESRPNLNLTDKSFSDVSADSSVLTTDYELIIKFKQDNETKTYKGSLILNIYRESSGIWYISRWNDIQSKLYKDFFTWSNLKVKFAN